MSKTTATPAAAAGAGFRLTRPQMTEPINDRPCIGSLGSGGFVSGGRVSSTGGGGGAAAGGGGGAAPGGGSWAGGGGGATGSGAAA